MSGPLNRYERIIASVFAEVHVPGATSMAFDRDAIVRAAKNCDSHSRKTWET